MKFCEWARKRNSVALFGYAWKSVGLRYMYSMLWMEFKFLNHSVIGLGWRVKRVKCFAFLVRRKILLPDLA